MSAAQVWAQKETPFQKRCLFFRRFAGNACLAVFVFLIQHWINGLRWFYRKKIKFPGQDLVRCLRKCGTLSSQTSALPLGINRSRCWTDSSPSTTTPTGRTCAAQRWPPASVKSASHSPYRDIPAEQRGLPNTVPLCPKR